MKHLLEKNIPETMRVCVRHYKDEKGHLSSTRAYLRDRDTDEVVGMGIARVNASERTPNRKRGRSIAIGRAMKSAGLRG